MPGPMLYHGCIFLLYSCHRCLDIYGCPWGGGEHYGIVLP